MFSFQLFPSSVSSWWYLAFFLLHKLLSQCKKWTSTMM
jgi:hypothetical protein